MDKEQIMIDGIDVVDCNYIIDHDPPKTRGTWGGAIHKGACKIYSKDCKHNPDCYFKQLTRKTQECEELKRKVELMKDCPDCKVDEYKKALDEIEKVCLEDTYTFADGTQIRYDSLDEILSIINKAKGEESD